jgi:hypothetical protein
VSFCYIPPPLLKIRRPCGSCAINCQPSETSILPLRCDSSDVRNDHYTRMALCGGSAFPQYTRPLLSWDDVQKLCPGYLEVQGFLRLRGGGGVRASAWYQRRNHAPCEFEVPPDWGLDAPYFRHACEE